VDEVVFSSPWAEAPSLDAPDRSDEVELLVAEFGAMDSSLRNLVSMVDRGASVGRCRFTLPNPR